MRHRDNRGPLICPICGNPAPIVIGNQDLDDECVDLLSLLPYNGEGTPS
jgi:hypothetical protein